MDGRSSGVLQRGCLCCHCLLIESEQGLTLVDTGFGLRDVRHPSGRLSWFFLRLLSPDFREEMTAIRQIERLGFKPTDVRNIVLTHLDFDHAGGLDDFPHAKVHLMRRERDEAMAQRTWLDRQRFRPQQWSGTRHHWTVHEPDAGERWFDFEGVRQSPGLPQDVLLIPLAGHTLGHAGIAVASEGRWLLLAGDAYFHHQEMNVQAPWCTPGLRLYQTLMEKDRSARLTNQDRLRALKQRHGDMVDIFSSHDTLEFERLRRATPWGRPPVSTAEEMPDPTRLAGAFGTPIAIPDSLSPDQEPDMSKPSLKPLAQQVIVITGASSGIGLATALAASQQGAKLVLAARSGATLDDVVAQIHAGGGQAVAVHADVSDRAQVEAIAEAALQHFGRIDTWINDAGISIFGRLDEVSDQDSQRLFASNFWGVVYGSLVALPHLRTNGGALINIGSEVSDAVFPLQGMYAASKHAVKGFTDALRVELEADEAPVSVTLVQPTAVDTPFPENAGNYLSQEPMLPSPMIEPEKVASAILDAATDPVRDVKVGAMSVINTTMSKLMPGIADTMAKLQLGRQQRNEVPHSREGSLYQPSESGRVHGRGSQNKADPDRARQTNVRKHVVVDGD